MKILRGFGLLFLALLVIGAFLSLFTPVLPHPKELSLPMLAVISAPLLVYFAVEMLSLFFELIGLTKRGTRYGKKMPEDSPDDKPRPKS